jgi:hypothetical protein
MELPNLFKTQTHTLSFQLLAHIIIAQKSAAGLACALNA